MISEAEQLKKRNRELSILNTIAEGLNQEVDLNQALQLTLELVVRLFSLRTGWVWLFQDGTEDPYLAASLNLPPGLSKNPKVMEGTCHCIDTFLVGDFTGAANVNAITCSRLKNLKEGTEGLRFHSSVPLYAHGKKLGILNVASSDWEEITEDDLQLLHTIGDLVGIAVERARLFSQSIELGATEERNRLAREIHDTLAQGLTAIALQLETADAMIIEDTEPTKAVIQKALALARDNLDEARRSVSDLRAASLQGRTLAQALETLTRERLISNNPEIKLKITGANQPLSNRIETGLFRIAQESLNNALQHADANTIEIQLAIAPKRVKLSIADDGKGFQIDPTNSEQFGLIGLNERAKLLGGNLEIQTEPEAGTRIEVTVPLI